MLSLLGLFGAAVLFVASRQGVKSSAELSAPSNDGSPAAELLFQASASAGNSPHHAQELRSAASSYLSVLR